MVPVSSQVLQRKEGYRQLYGLYAWLQLVTRQDYGAMEFAELLETKDTATLFEYWCFFVVKEVLEDASWSALGVSLQSYVLRLRSRQWIKGWS